MCGMENLHFRAKIGNFSETEQDKAIVSIKYLYGLFILVPRLMTLNDLELLSTIQGHINCFKAIISHMVLQIAMLSTA